MRRSATAVLGAGAATAIALAGCGNGDEAEPAVGEVTPPGTELSIGETAIVPASNTDGTDQLIGLTITAIDRGSPADLAELTLDNGAAAMVPYYITYTVSNESGADLSSSSHIKIRGRLPDGSPAPTLTILGTTFEPCDNKSAPGEFTEVGASYETCRVALADESSSVAGAEWWDGRYADEPIAWTS